MRSARLGLSFSARKMGLSFTAPENGVLLVVPRYGLSFTPGAFIPDTVGIGTGVNDEAIGIPDPDEIGFIDKKRI